MLVSFASHQKHVSHEQRALEKKSPAERPGFVLLDRCLDYAARTELRNFETSALRRLLSPESICADDSTCEDAEPVSVAPRCTSVMLDETCCVPWEACWTLREISCVAAPCSSTAAAMVEEIPDSRSMVPLISLMALTDSLVAAWMPEICALTSP